MASPTTRSPPATPSVAATSPPCRRRSATRWSIPTAPPGRSTRSGPGSRRPPSAPTASSSPRRPTSSRRRSSSEYQNRLIDAFGPAYVTRLTRYAGTNVTRARSARSGCGRSLRASCGTYGDVSPGSPRFAGAVLFECDEPDLPWWRVVRADGSLAKGARQHGLWSPRACRSGVSGRHGRRPDRRFALVPTCSRAAVYATTPR